MDSRRVALIPLRLASLCAGSVASSLSPADLDKIVEKTAGYSGSDMRNLIQEACQGPVRDAVAARGAAIAGLSDADLRPVTLRDFQMAARAQKASVSEAEVQRYIVYNNLYGARAAGGVDVDGAEDEEEW